MGQDEIRRQIEELERQIAALPKGSVTKKTIHNHVYYYHQWTEEGRKKSRYLQEGEREALQEQIARRRELQAQVRELKAKAPKLSVPQASPPRFETNVRIGRQLQAMAGSVRGFHKRDIYEQLEQYVYGKDPTRVCVVYGLRRTGKTTMLFQAMAGMPAEDFSKTAYIKARRTDTMAMINRDLERLQEAGFQYVFIDEATLMEDFIDSAALFSDVFVPMGLRIVLSGTDSLGFWLAEDDELYDRVRMIHTTYIPYREYSHLLGIDSIDEYIRYGGTFRMGGTNFDDEELKSDDASFRDDESTRRYIDTAICRNIQHSLACYERGNHFRHLYSLYEAGELTGAINRIIEDMNHRFLLSVLTKDFVSGDLGIAARNLRKERDPAKRTAVLDAIDAEAVTRRLMEILDIRNSEERSVGITPSHVKEIQSYLKALDLIVSCPTEYAEPGIEPEEHILFTQPGMRYCQAQALVHSLMKDETFLSRSEQEKAQVSERILEEVRGRMMEDILLLESLKALGERYRVFKLRFERGEFDMVIYDTQANCCAAYEIKHSSKAVPEQARHLRDEEKCALTRQRFGELTGRYVLYLGEETDMDGIAYRNAEQFLKQLPAYSMEGEPTEKERPDFGLSL